MTEVILQQMVPAQWGEVARLIYHSTNAWYTQNGKPPIFGGEEAACDIFCQVYEALDPGCCLVAVDAATQAVIGSCFYHPRPSHFSVGIVNTHPEHFSRGIARKMLEAVLALADQAQKPVRLVSSAMNLDSFSLYTRLGFVPRGVFQDLLLPDPSRLPAADPHVRPVTHYDSLLLAELEQELVGLERQKDYAYFTGNALGIWSGSVYEDDNGTLQGYLFSVQHPASNLLGPGVARTEPVAAALIAAERRKHPGNPVVLVPASSGALIQTLYGWGGRNCELHLAQVRGEWSEPRGVVLPTFLPESG